MRPIRQALAGLQLATFAPGCVSFEPRPPAEPIAVTAGYCQQVHAALALPVVPDPGQGGVDALREHRTWAEANHAIAWAEHRQCNDAIRYHFWQTISTDLLGDHYRLASVEALRVTKDLLHQTLEALARRINAVDSMLQGLALGVQPGAPGGVAGGVA